MDLDAWEPSGSHAELRRRAPVGRAQAYVRGPLEDDVFLVKVIHPVVLQVGQPVL